MLLDGVEVLRLREAMEAVAVGFASFRGESRRCFFVVLWVVFRRVFLFLWCCFVVFSLGFPSFLLINYFFSQWFFYGFSMGLKHLNFYFLYVFECFFFFSPWLFHGFSKPSQLPGIVCLYGAFYVFILLR